MHCLALSLSLPSLRNVLWCRGQAAGVLVGAAAAGVELLGHGGHCLKQARLEKMAVVPPLEVRDVFTAAAAADAAAAPLEGDDTVTNETVPCQSGSKCNCRLRYTFTSHQILL